MTLARAPHGSRSGAVGGRAAAALLLRAILAAGALSLAAPSTAAAQLGVTTIAVVNGLNFGLLLPGMTTSVAPGDAARRAEVWVTGSGNLDIRLVLPTQMASVDGDLFPLRFVAGDGATASSKDPTPATFDPNATVRVNLTSQGGTARIYLGGTAVPGVTQFPGVYTATVSIVVTRVNQ